MDSRGTVPPPGRRAHQVRLGGSRSKATAVTASMNSSSHRIWSGSSGCAKPAYRGDEQRPSSATCVDTRKTRPFLDVVHDPATLGQSRP